MEYETEASMVSYKNLRCEVFTLNRSRHAVACRSWLVRKLFKYLNPWSRHTTPVCSRLAPYAWGCGQSYIFADFTCLVHRHDINHDSANEGVRSQSTSSQPACVHHIHQEPSEHSREKVSKMMSVSWQTSRKICLALKKKHTLRSHRRAFLWCREKQPLVLRAHALSTLGPSGAPLRGNSCSWVLIYWFPSESRSIAVPPMGVVFWLHPPPFKIYMNCWPIQHITWDWCAWHLAPPPTLPPTLQQNTYYEGFNRWSRQVVAGPRGAQ